MADHPPVVSFSQLQTLDRCKLQWSFKYIHKFDTTKRRTRMDIGTMGHEMLFDWYTTGVDHSEEYVTNKLKDWGSLDAEQIKAINLAAAMFRLYVSEFSPLVDRELDTRGLEYHFEVPMQTPLGRSYVLQGYIDRMSVDRRGHLWVEDYKWTSRFWSQGELQMDPQLTFYAGALAYLGFDVHGTMITQVNTYDYTAKSRAIKTIDELFKRELIYRSPVEISTVMFEVGHLVDELLELQEAEGKTFYPRSLRRECGKMCDFYEPCSLGLKGIDPALFMESSPGYKTKTSRPVLNLEVQE